MINNDLKKYSFIAANTFSVLVQRTLLLGKSGMRALMKEEFQDGKMMIFFQI